MQETGCDPLVDDHSFGNVPHTVDSDYDLLENWDDDGAGDNRNKDLNSDDSVDEVFPFVSLWSSLHNVLAALYQFD
jgi:hypothetical protein